MARGTRSQITRKLISQSPDNYERLLFAAVARLCGDALICTDRNGVISGWSDSASRMYGYSAEEMMGTSFSRLLTQDEDAREAEELRHLEVEGVRRHEAERITKTSATLRVSCTACAISNDSGAVIGAVRMEREIAGNSGEEESRSRLAAIVESSDDAIVSKNLDGIVTSWNQAAVRLFGHTAEEMIGQSILKIIPPELHFEEEEILRKLRAGQRIEHYETMRLRKDGGLIEVSLTISPIKDRRDTIIGVSKIAREISQRKKMERMLIQSEKLSATARMAATIAHEINNPLDSVMNLVYLARTMLAVNSKALPYLLTAEAELERVSHIARQTLGYYRDPGPPSEIHLEHLLEEVLGIYRSKMLAGNVAVDCAFTHFQTIRASKDELMQIFSNLILNAIDAMPEGGVLNIQTREVNEKGIEISVRDKGTGIGHENLDRVFEPFFSTKGDRGTGIGLWVARQLLEKRGGSIDLQSSTEFPHSGTTVSVFLPFQT